jgi:Zn-dependent peptidase ImmA (M78 family)
MRFRQFKLNFMDAIRDFLPIAVEHLQLTNLPNIEFERNLKDTQVPTFGRFDNDTRTISLDIENRHPVDVLRTLAHELVHFKQELQHELKPDSWKTGSPIEDEANAEAGVVMRKFNTNFPQYLKLKPIMLPIKDKK